MLPPPLFWERSCCPPSLGGPHIKPLPRPHWLGSSVTPPLLLGNTKTMTHLGHLLIIWLNCLLTQRVRKVIATLAVTSLVSPIWRLQRQVINQSQYDVQSSLLSPQDVRILFVIRISRVENPMPHKPWLSCAYLSSICARYPLTSS